jgi:hypothetical protein
MIHDMAILQGFSPGMALLSRDTFAGEAPSFAYDYEHDFLWTATTPASSDHIVGTQCPGDKQLAHNVCIC